MKLGAIDDSADIAVHFCTPMIYKPIWGVRNVLFTMFESNDVTHHFPNAFEQSDLIITPSKFCRDLFTPLTDRPVRIVPLGINPRVFRYKKRSWKPDLGEPFRWLVLGAPNSRKFSILDDLCREFLDGFGERVEVYFKTSGIDLSKGLKAVQESGLTPMRDGEVVRLGNRVVDTRRVSQDQLVDFYYKSHGLLALHLGEGWGLTAHESMACGTPVVVTDWSGTRDFCSKNNAYPVSTVTGKGEVILDKETFYLTYHIPKLEDTIQQVANVMLDYKLATKKARIASQTARRLSWENSAKTLIREVYSVIEQ